LNFDIKLDRHQSPTQSKTALFFKESIHSSKTLLTGSLHREITQTPAFAAEFLTYACMPQSYTQLYVAL
jgi:hypothetical protein